MITTVLTFSLITLYVGTLLFLINKKRHLRTIKNTFSKLRIELKSNK